MQLRSRNGKSIFLVALSIVVLLSIIVVPAWSQGSVSTQLVMILDGSGSVGSTNWGIIKEGLASAVENSACLPQDGSVELTVIQFGTSDSPYARVELSPTVITAANVASVAATIRAMSYGYGFTPMAYGIHLAVDTVAASGNFNASIKQAINLVTDGEPNECDTTWPCPDYLTNTVSARDYAISTLQMTDAQDEFDAEGIGITTSNKEWLRDHIVFPQPGYDTWPPPGPGWVRVVASAQEFADTVCEKITVIVPTPTPTTPPATPTPTTPPGTPTPTVPAPTPTPTVPAPTPTPEPFIPEANTMILLGSGLAGLAGYASIRLRAWRRKE